MVDWSQWAPNPGTSKKVVVPSDATSNRAVAARSAALQAASKKGSANDLMGGLFPGGNLNKPPASIAAPSSATGPGDEFDWGAFMAEFFGGGGGGGGSYYDPRPAIQAQYQAQRDKAGARKGEVSGEYTKLYGQLADAYKPLGEQTGQRYQQAAAASAAGSEGLINATQSRINEEASKRAAAYAELGIEGPQATAGEATGQAAEAQNAMTNLSQIGGNWAGLMGAQQQAEQGRNQLDYTGAVDAGTMAQDQLTRNYNAFLDNLALQEQADLAGAQPSYSGGGGGGGGSSIPSGVQNAIWTQYFTEMGILPPEDSGSSYTPSKFERAIDLFGEDAVNAYYAGKDSKTWNPSNKYYNAALSGYLSGANSG